MCFSYSVFLHFVCLYRSGPDIPEDINEIDLEKNRRKSKKDGKASAPESNSDMPKPLSYQQVLV